jgi:small subunit ribosomal protein S8
MTDPIADLMVRLKQGSRRLFEKVDLPSSKLKLAILRILKAEGFIANYKVMEDARKRPFIRVYLKYTPSKQESLQGVKRVSKSGLRVYKPYTAFARRDHSGIITIISTPKGLLTDRQAHQAKVGGEVLCQVW